MADEQNNTENNENTDTSTENGGETTVTMTQEKLDSLINSRFAKGAEKAQTELLQTLGVDDVDVLKSLVTTHREQEDASKSELQKMQELLELEQSRAAELEGKLTSTLTETEIQNIVMQYGINPEKMKYFKMDYLEAKQDESFDLEKFIGVLKEKQPDFFGFIDERKNRTVPNPQSKNAPTGSIKMSDYAQLPAVERKKYKSSDIIR